MTTERKQVGKALREESRLQAALLDNIPGCVALILKKDTREIVASNRFAREIGAVPGQTCFVTCASRDDACPFCLAPELWATGRPQQIEVEYRGTWYEGIWAPLSEDLYVHYIFDITERKRAEESVRRTQFVVDHSQDLVHWVDSEGRLLYVNDASCRRLGYSREELLGMTVNDIDPLAPRPWAGHFQETGEGGSLTFESSHQTKDGEIFPVEVTVNYVIYGGQEYSCASARDITERKRGEELLRLTQFSVDHAADAVFWTDPDGHLTLVNDSACRLFGYPRDELLVMNVRDLDPSASAEVRSANWERMKEEGTFTFETSVRTKSGGTFPVEVTVNYLQFAGREYNCVFTRDITERKRAEEALRRAQFSVDHVADCIFWADHDGRYTDVNQTTCALLGYSRDELLTMSVFDLTVGLSPDAWPDRWRELKEHGPFTFEKQYRTKNGEIFPVEINSRILEYEGREYLVGILRDTTERKLAEEALRQSEEQLRQSQKMEAVGQLAGGIAHDFNNLLTSILGYSELLLASAEFSASSAREDLEEIKHAGERASALTQQILAFSRRQILRPAALTLNEVLDGMESLLRRTLGEDIDLVTLEHPHLDLTEVDRHQFEQVLMNLALNARDAMPSGGRLTLETGNVELGEEYCQTHPEAAPGSYVMLSVSDTGVGMDPETMDHAFEPFFTTKAFGQGSGLGLAVIHGIVTQSHGSIFVHSEPGKGTTFKIYLPRAARSAIPKEVTISAHVSARGSETVMVVEDEAALRSLIDRILGGAGYTTLSFGSATEALEALERGKCSVDLLLTDVMLPGALQGHDLARTILATRPDLPVLFISGYTRDALVHAGRLDEGVNLLEKPFTPEALATMVRSVLDQPNQ